MTFCFWKTGFLHSRSGTYYALLLGSFGLKYLPDIQHCVCWVSAEIWAPNSSHKICNKIFIHHSKAKRKVCLCVQLFDFFPRWILIRFTLNLSHLFQIQWRFLHGILTKKLFPENFSEIICKPKLSSTKLCKIWPSYCIEKNSHKYFHMLFAPS